MAEAEHTLRALAGFGVNAIFTEAELYRDDLIELAHWLHLRWFGGLACFSDHAHGHRVLRDRPELWPIDESGQMRPQREWYIGVTPTFEDYNAERIVAAERLVRAHDLDGFMLDFVRWPIHWETELRTGATQPLQSSFDAHTLARFQAGSGMQLPMADPAVQARWIVAHHYDAWVDFKCNVITRFVAEAVTRLRATRGPGLTLGLFALPLPQVELEAIAGQRLDELAPLVDIVAPMVYHALLQRPVEWVTEVVASMVTRYPGQVVPVLQIGVSAAMDSTPQAARSEWRAVVQAALRARATAGLIVFAGDGLVRDGLGETLHQQLVSDGSV